MTYQIAAEIIIHPVRQRPDAEASVERTHAKSKAFAALTEAIEAKSSPATEGTAHSRCVSPSLTPCVVLVVDDEPAVLTITALRLRRSGYDVLEASSGLEAVLTLESRADICVVLADCNMMPMRGAELAKLVLKRWPHIGYVAMSREPPYSDLPDEVSFIHKPHSISALVATIEGERSAAAVRVGARPGTA